MRPMPIVSVQPLGQVFSSLFGTVVGSRIGPFVQRGFDEAFGFAVGSRGIGSGSDMLQFQSSAQFREARRAVAGAVVCHDAGEGDAERLEVAQRVEQGAAGALRRLVRLDASKTDAGMIVDSHMHVFPSGSRRFQPSVSGNPMAWPHETPEPLYVEMQQVARMRVDVATRRNRRIEMGQSVQSGLLDDAAHRAVRHAGSLANLPVRAPFAAKFEDRSTLFLRGAMRTTRRTRRTVFETFSPLRAIPGQPLVRGAYADSRSLGGFLDANPVVNDALHQKLSTFRRQSGIFVYFHADLPMDCDWMCLINSEIRR